MELPIIFNNSIPKYYENYLSAFLFNDFAEDIIKRVELPKAGAVNVLELAAGTGIVTEYLISHLPDHVKLTVSDIEEDMLNIAKAKINSESVEWSIVDMCNIQYEGNVFSNIICQFALMLVPDKEKACREIYRVMKKDGQFIFNVWNSIHENPIWKIGGEVIESFIGVNPVLQNPGPFSLNIENATGLLQDSGFSDIKCAIVNYTGIIESAANAVKGFIEGLPVSLLIRKKNPDSIPVIYEALKKELIDKLGDKPLQSPLQALVFEVHK